MRTGASNAGAATRQWLTDQGREQHTRVATQIRAMRNSVTDGLSAEDYRAVVAGLARMAENLERMLAT